ncbi:hypothetical protein V6N13_091182 [Hibiscus sabdariffa]
MVEGQPVSMVEHTPQGGNKVHAAVSLFEKGHGRGSSDGIVLGKTRGGEKARRMSHIRGSRFDGALEPIVSGDVSSAIRTIVPAAGLGIEGKGSVADQ